MIHPRTYEENWRGWVIKTLYFSYNFMTNFMLQLVEKYDLKVNGIAYSLLI
jgi:hypothetical protein